MSNYSKREKIGRFTELYEHHGERIRINKIKKAFIDFVLYSLCTNGLKLFIFYFIYIFGVIRMEGKII